MISFAYHRRLKTLQLGRYARQVESKLTNKMNSISIIFYYSDFWRKRNIYAWCGFLLSQFSPIEIISCNKNVLYPIKDIGRLLEFTCKNMFYLHLFFVKFWGFEICQFGHVLDKIMRYSNFFTYLLILSKIYKLSFFSFIKI